MTLRSLLRRKAALKPQTSMQGGIEGICCGVVLGVGISSAHAGAPARVDFMLAGRAIGRALAFSAGFDLDVRLVSYGAHFSATAALMRRFQ